MGRPARLPARPAPDRRRRRASVGGRAPRGHRDARRPGAIVNGTFGNRPHCIYRGFCLQGCKVNAKASPLVTHVSAASASSAPPRCAWPGTRSSHPGCCCIPRRAVPPPGWRTEPTRSGGTHGAGRPTGRRAVPRANADVQGAPPEVSSEQFYETDPRRGFARGFSIQTVAPLPIGWAEHVLADGHWGAALRAYMRDYNHWAVLGALCELLPRAENRVTLADETDAFGMPIARFDYTQCDNDRTNIAYAKRILQDIWDGADAQDILAIDRYAHLVGGCRMGADPDNSVIDADHRAWDLANLFICDGSVMPIQGSANPALTIMALASRLGERLARKQIAGCGRGGWAAWRTRKSRPEADDGALAGDDPPASETESTRRRRT